jgi:hypothetical protein
MSNYAPITYQIRAANYTVRNFEFRPGDTLRYDSGISVLVINPDPTDGLVTIEGYFSSETSSYFGTIELRLGENTNRDGEIVNPDTFKEVFGSNSLIYDQLIPDLSIALDHSVIYEQPGSPNTANLTINGTANSVVELALTENNQVSLADFSFATTHAYDIVQDANGQPKVQVTLNAEGQATVSLTALQDNESETEELLQITVNEVGNSQTAIANISVNETPPTPSLDGQIVYYRDFIETFGYETYQSLFNDYLWYDSSNPNGFYLDEVDSNGDGFIEIYHVDIATGERVLISQALTDAGWDSFYISDTSQDGQFAVIGGYHTNDPDLPTDNYIYNALYLVEANGNTRLLSDGMSWAWQGSINDSISDDGRYVVFQGQTLGDYSYQVYLYDTATEQLKTITSPENGTYYSAAAGISDDGRFIYYSNTVYDAAGNTNASLVQYDISTGTQTELADWTEAYGSSWIADISNDGRYLLIDTDYAFSANDNNGLTDVYVFDTASRNFTLVSQTPDGQAGQGSAYGYAISDDGHYVKLYSDIDLLTGAPNNANEFIADGQGWWWNV